MIDPYGRHINYLRVSVTDRCDFRCIYCMSEHMQFLPKSELLSLEELELLCSRFIALGVRRLRITGGEPLVRRNVMQLFQKLGQKLGDGLDELTLTTNGSQLAQFASELFRCGVKRVNVSLDTLDEGNFAAITRRGRLADVLQGLRAAQAAGLSVKINTVALRGINEHEIAHILRWCGSQGFDLCLIETMPLGDTGEDRTSQYLPLSTVRARLRQEFSLEPSPYKTGGPARYFKVAETGGRLGFITPMTHNFCESCNRVRLTCTGQLFLCLGQEDQADLRSVVRSGGDLDVAIAQAIAHKPRGHDFMIDRRDNRPSLARHMSLTGG